ncbi:MAG: DUF2059 domain-containing protein [Candidatus Sulfotelmatobacter sp.]
MKTFAVMVWIILLGCLSAQTQPSAQAQAVQQAGPTTAPASKSKIDPAKEADIRQFMEVAGIKTLMAQTLENMSKSLRPLMTQALPPGEYRDKLVELFFAKFQSKADLQQVLDLIVPFYDQHFSDEEIKGLIKFYQTPLGQKMVQVIPQLTTESQQVSQEWGEKLGRQSMIEVLSEHPDLQKAMEQAKQ